MNFPVREAFLGGTALMAQVTPDIPGTGDIKSLGIYVVVLVALLWVIYQERTERKEMRDSQTVEREKRDEKFTQTINQLSEAIAGLSEKKRPNGH